MPQLISNLLWVMLGASLGGGSRYLISLIVNILGGLLAGIIAGYLLQKPDQAIRLFLIVGFCGGLTTFSSFSLETMSLLQNREYFNSMMLMLLHLTGSIGATFLGFYLINTMMNTSA